MNRACYFALIALTFCATTVYAQYEETPAAKKARVAIEKDPANADKQLAYADILIEVNEPEEAWTSLEKALEANAKDGRLDVRLGDVFVLLAKKEAARSQDGTTIRNFYLDAERMYVEALKKDSKLYLAHYGTAIVNFNLNEKEKARKAIADCLGVKKDFGKAHALQAQMFYNERKFAEARDKFEIALKLDQSVPVTFVRYGHCFLLLKQPAKAQEAYIEVLKYHPDYTASILSGLINLAGKSYKKATPYLKAAVDAAPKSPVAWFYYGYTLEVNSMFDKALKAYGKALKLRPKNAQYTYYVGLMHEKKNDGGTALDYYRKALRLNPDYAEAAGQAWGIAVSYASQNFDQAEKLLEEFIKLAPRNGWIQNNYALMLRDWAERRGAAKGDNLSKDVKRRIKRSGEVYELAAAVLVKEAQIQSDCGLLFEFYPSCRDDAKAEKYFLRALEISEFTYRDAWSGVRRLCMRTKNWELLHDCADGVLGALEDSGRVPTAPVGRGAPKPVPNARPMMIAQAKQALTMGK